MKNKHRTKNLITGLLALALLTVSSLSVPARAEPRQENISVNYNNIQVQIQGQQLNMTDADGNQVKPFSYNGTIYLPLRSIAEALGLEASYDADLHAVYLTGTVSATNTLTNNQDRGSLSTGDQNPGAPPTGNQNPGTPPDGQQNLLTPPDMSMSTGNQNIGAPPTGNQNPGTPPDGQQNLLTPPDMSMSTGNQNMSAPTEGNEVPGMTNPGTMTTEKIEVNYNDITVYLNDELLELVDANGNAVYPFSYNGTIYLPVRAICQALGLTVAYDSDQRMVSMTCPNGPNVSETSSTSVSGNGVYEQSGDEVTETGQDYEATETNQSCVKVTEGGVYTLSDAILNKTGDTTSEEASNFTGLNAAVLAESGSIINLDDCTIDTDASGSNAVFATGEGTTIYISGSTIVTARDSSRGLDATYGGAVVADNVDITTSGDHCAALATDRGEGTIDVTGGTMETSGEGSPGIYSTGTITVDGATISATGSEAAVVEGKNSIDLTDTIISGTVNCGVMLYQSFSGDADVGTSSFTMNGGSLTAEEGPLFFCTNTSTVIELAGAAMDGSSGILLSAVADQWGTSGSNGAEVIFTADDESLIGDVLCDSLSTIAMSLQNGSMLEGAINHENTGREVSLELDSDSSWIMTGDSYLTVLVDRDEDLDNIDDNGYTIYYDEDATGNSWLGGETITLTDGGTLTPQ